LGNPVLLVGDSPQNLPQKLTIAEMHTYFADCKSKGINLCWICIDGQPTDRAINAAPVDRKGNPEFLPGGTPENWDLSRVNPAYYNETIDSVLILAEYYGIYVNLMPMSQCYWSSANITANSPEKCFDYGVFLGMRYKDQRNILWLFGNDNLDSSRQCPIARGILSTGDKHLMSIHVYDPSSPWGPDPLNTARGKTGNYFKNLPNSTMTWVSYNNLYSDMQVFNQASFIYQEYRKKDVMPILMTEGPYQKLSPYHWQVATNQVERGLNYRVALGGGFGGAYTYGCDWMQTGTEPWDKYLNAGARPHIKYFSALFRDRPWWKLVPDWDQEFLTSTTLKGGLDIEDDNYTMAAYDAAEGTLGIVYCTVQQTVTLDLSKLSGPATIRWYDPTNGNFTDIDGNPFDDKGLHQFTTPALSRQEVNTDNSQETSSDWVLVVEISGTETKHQ
ncbi:MAG TPA: DUF4038 domain-containing protein, partial [Cyclobacteriaceae bacterium]|nr:DUF4038 domain-containing protein [Cyclobacteriaceae bacterium]